MCLILFAYQKHPIYKLIVAANRDEAYKRPTAAAQFWEDNPQILAGRDMEKMGTWMGVTKGGRFSALTNYRDLNETTAGKRTRGELVSDALIFHGEISDYMDALAKSGSIYPGYNLLAGDANELYYYSNVGKVVLKLQPGVYGLSNHLLDCDWPKVKRGKESLKKLLSLSENDLINELFQLLSNEEQALDDVLPHTGVPLEIERMLSPLFIKSEGYGTRCSTILLMSDSEIRFIEREFLSDGTSHAQSFLIPL
ncbi:NRDE family protein [Robertmurraya kyonggiensis]|uniref:NRDE family protein n=1 Tax=Robertmurraya kyonggiensis TaxID=1037680 RepID=A0A4U1DBK5_9BACI|nr:NRDE family protein [Robertmurraya kyonggiensis]TKC19443.1 NRDE family protein [Robertmurraya kyonggiensis]